MRQYLFSLLIISLIGVAIATPIMTYSQTTLIPKTGSCADRGDCTPVDFVALFVRGADIIVGLSGTASILMFVYGGFLMITAYGNDSRIKQGRDAIVATVIGILIVLLAWTLINLVITALYGGSPESAWYQITNGGGITPQNGATPNFSTSGGF
ncbi:MAG TPA: hypothetical protein PK412_03445 [bacterium]|nr:hypothetical protein [bacterium]